MSVVMIIKFTENNLIFVRLMWSENNFSYTLTHLKQKSPLTPPKTIIQNRKCHVPLGQKSFLHFSIIFWFRPQTNPLNVLEQPKNHEYTGDEFIYTTNSVFSPISVTLLYTTLNSDRIQKLRTEKLY